KANGYATVLRIRSPGQDDAAERTQAATRRGLKYLSLELSPETLSRSLEDQFTKIVMDNANQRLFVYDDDGVLAGAVWYLHFRFEEGVTDEKARTRARTLGLRDDVTGETGVMWVAIQKYLKSRSK